MRYSKALFTLTFILCQFLVAAQEKGVLRGQALEKGTKEPLPNAAVTIVVRSIKRSQILMETSKYATLNPEPTASNFSS